MQANPNLIDKWCQLKALLVHEFQQNDFIFEQAKFLSKEQISSAYQKVHDAESFLAVLENNFQRDYVVEFICNLTDYTKLHTGHGTIKLADCIRQYQSDTVKRKRHAWIHGFLPDQNFVGRETDIVRIMNLLFCDTLPGGNISEIIGVSICGPGGMGKTSLAVEICYQLHQTDMWTIGKVDLREKERLVDLLWDTLRALGKSGHGDDVVSLKHQLFEALRQTDRQTLLLFDNIEGIVWSESQSLTELLVEMADQLIKGKNRGKVKILLTTRAKIVQPNTDGAICHNFVEHELKPLSDLQSLELLQKSIEPRLLSASEGPNIVALCGNTPLAITMIAGTLRSLGNNCPASEVIESLQAGHKSNDTSEILDKCFHKTFSTLHDEYKKKFIRLAVFHTAPFDIRSAMNILSDDEVYRSSTHRAKNDLLYLKSRHLVETDALPEILCNGDSRDENIFRKGESFEFLIQFSLHPLVFEYLKGKCSINEYLADVQKSKIEFQVYFTRKLQTLGEKHSQDPIATVKLIEENRTHFANFYDTLAQIDVSNQIAGSSQAGTITEADKFWQSKHLPEIADIVLNSKKKIDIFSGISKRCRDSGKLSESCFWNIECVKECAAADDIDMAAKIIIQLDIDLSQTKSQTREDISEYLHASFVGVKGLYYWHCPRTTENLKSALELLEESMVLYEHCQLNDVFATEKAEIVNLIGCVYFKMDDLEKSIEYHQKASNIILDYVKPKDGVHFKLSVYLANIGCAWHQRGNRVNEDSTRPFFEKALQFYNQAITLDRTINIHTRERHSDKLRNRADVYYGLNEYKKALEDAKRALELRRCHYEGRPNRKVTSSMHQVGYILMQLGQGQSYSNEDKAMEYFKQAETFYDDARKEIAIGGYLEQDNDYEIYKDEYIRLLKTIGDHKKGKRVEHFFGDYESGLYKKTIEKMKIRSWHTRSTDTESSSSGDSTSDDEMLTELSSLEQKCPMNKETYIQIPDPDPKNTADEEKTNSPSTLQAALSEYKHKRAHEDSHTNADDTQLQFSPAPPTKCYKSEDKDVPGDNP